ncbi:hypothetical protein KKB10_06645 [Patescibacteria group bacterium]|nr:hypothetical protein [Patescibacteria group bacterium]MBU1074964.1 hypothetical protein [Patescibacteria group bacterium]MBU1951447.1 hypothetical protein [Patescibacteria group bacterium]
MEENQQDRFHLRSDLASVIVITLVLSGILVGLVFADNQSGVITDLAKTISQALIK